MSRILFRWEDADGEWWGEWSSICDAPIGPAMTIDELRRHLPTTDDAEARIARARMHGTSSLRPCSLAELLAGNRAGPHEAELLVADLLAMMRGGESPGWLGVNAR